MTEQEERERLESAPAGRDDRPQSQAVDYINAEDLFYWMDCPCDAEIPPVAPGIELPPGCRFCI